MARWGRSVVLRVDEALGALNASVAQGYPRRPRTCNARTWLYGRHEGTDAPEAAPVPTASAALERPRSPVRPARCRGSAQVSAVPRQDVDIGEESQTEIRRSHYDLAATIEEVGEKRKRASVEEVPGLEVQFSPDY